MARRNHARGAVKVRGPAVVAEAVPCLAHRALRSARQLLDRRVARQKTRIEVQHAANLRLLQHDLGDQNRVRVARPPPRQVAPVPPVPGNQTAAKDRELGRIEPWWPPAAPTTRADLATHSVVGFA